MQLVDGIYLEALVDIDKAFGVEYDLYAVADGSSPLVYSDYSSMHMADEYNVLESNPVLEGIRLQLDSANTPEEVAGVISDILREDTVYNPNFDTVLKKGQTVLRAFANDLELGEDWRNRM